MTRAVTLTAAVLGNLLGMTKVDAWCEWLSDVLKDYWARRHARSANR